MNRFDELVAGCGGGVLRRGELEVLQLNVGRRCNQACRHCHVDAGPWRREMLDGVTAGRIVDWIGEHRPGVVDITGGAPELSEYFRFLVEGASGVGARVIDRCNLTIFEEDGFGDLPEFLAGHGVEVVASLPCYSAEGVDGQRGGGVFERSIRGLQRLNGLGYGMGGGLLLYLVYNPLGACLPGAQDELELVYRRELREGFGVEFDGLLTMANLPIARFADWLRRRGEWDGYLELLVNSFNPRTLPGLMCRGTLSVGYRGELFDCDFNQMLGLGLGGERGLFLWDVAPSDLVGGRVATGVHCLGCAAGSGSGCGGALV